MSSFKGKITLITGSASGIGKLMALEAARKGSTIVLWDIDQGGMDAVKASIEKSGGKAFAYKVDLSESAQIYSTAKQVESEAGPVDILINNAGIVNGKPFMECSDQAIEKSIRINLLAHFWTVKAFLPGMLKKDSGHIVAIASAAGLIGTPKMSDYSAAKFGAVGFDESLRSELKKSKSHVRTTIVCPFYIDTGMFAGVKTRFPLILPILKQEKVCARIISAIERNKPRLLMPWIVYTVSLLRILPVGMFDFIAGILGVNSAMDEFTGRK